MAETKGKDGQGRKRWNRIERRLDFEQGEISTQIHRPSSSTKRNKHSELHRQWQGRGEWREWQKRENEGTAVENIEKISEWGWRKGRKEPETTSSINHSKLRYSGGETTRAQSFGWQKLQCKQNHGKNILKHCHAMLDLRLHACHDCRGDKEIQSHYWNLMNFVTSCIRVLTFVCWSVYCYWFESNVN